MHLLLVALEEGKCAHEQIIESGWDSDIFVWEWLGGQHAKCGSMEDAWKVFNKLPSPDMATWNAICREHAIHGHGKEALNPFEQMYEEGVQPDDITFVCLLSACSHEGLVDEGMHCYTSMITDYMISAKLKHYTCVVDPLQEAENMIKVVPL
jgi:pentatricopeptide repeat protein